MQGLATCAGPSRSFLIFWALLLCLEPCPASLLLPFAPQCLGSQPLQGSTFPWYMCRVAGRTGCHLPGLVSKRVGDLQDMSMEFLEVCAPAHVPQSLVQFPDPLLYLSILLFILISLSLSHGLPLSSAPYSSFSLLRSVWLPILIFSRPDHQHINEVLYV